MTGQSLAVPVECALITVCLCSLFITFILSYLSEWVYCTRGGLHLPGAIFGVLCMPVMLSGPVLAFFKSFLLLPFREPKICGTLTKFDSTLLENAVCS